MVPLLQVPCRSGSPHAVFGALYAGAFAGPALWRDAGDCPVGVTARTLNSAANATPATASIRRVMAGPRFVAYDARSITTRQGDDGARSDDNVQGVRAEFRRVARRVQRRTASGSAESAGRWRAR